MVLMLLLETLFWPGHGLAWRQGTLPGAVARAASGGSNTPPWGRLEYTPIALDRPDEYFTNDFSQSPKPVWVFQDHSAEKVSTLFTSLELTESTRAWLANRTNWQFLPHTIIIAPPPEVVLSLSPETRRRFYETLGRLPGNYLQAMPFRFRADGFDDWFAGCGLPSEKMELVRRLSYPQAGTLCFADAATFGQISTPEETKCLIKSLWRVSTFVMKVQVNPRTDIDALVNYWGVLGAARTYKPLLESMARVPEGTTLNISYFLPPFARLRLFTYPNPREPQTIRQDCFWSSMNFFNTTPDNGYFDPAYTRQVLASDFARVRDSSRHFGDLLMLLGADQQALHMCVYIADDVVFTKNGANPQQPWVLMKLSEMLGQYEKDQPFEIVVYRRTAPPPLGAVEKFSSARRIL